MSFDEQLLDAARAFDAAMGPLCKDAIGQVVRVTENHARTTHDWQSRTGTTARDLIRGSLDVAGSGGATGSVVFLDNAARLIEGTPAHAILPKEGSTFEGPLPKGQSRRAKNDVGTHRAALRWNEGGTTHFARKVQHPGTKPDPYFDRAADVGERELDRVADEVAEKLITIFTRAL